MLRRGRWQPVFRMEADVVILLDCRAILPSDQPFLYMSSDSFENTRRRLMPFQSSTTVIKSMVKSGPRGARDVSDSANENQQV